MRKSQYTLFMIAVFAHNWLETIQILRDNGVHLKTNMDDLYDLMSLIHNKSKNKIDVVRHEESYRTLEQLTTNIPDTVELFNNNGEKSRQTQKATLNDVLMMKLVSYYEDKYKVADHEPTERGTKISLLSENDILDGENKDALKIGSGSKNFKSYISIMDVPEVVIA